MDRAAGAAVEANRLHDRERRGPGEDLDVGTAQHTGVFRDDGGGRVLGYGVEVRPDRVQVKGALTFATMSVSM